MPATLRAIRGGTIEEGLTATAGVGVGAAGAAFGPAGLAAGGGLALYLHLHDSDDDPELPREAVFEVLVSDELTPTARAEIEEQLDLPPRTISNFQRLMTGNTVEQLLQHRDRLDAELGGVESRLLEIESTIAQYDNELRQLSELLATLDDEAVNHTDITAYMTSSAP